jgi:hypothetical protein
MFEPNDRNTRFGGGGSFGIGLAVWSSPIVKLRNQKSEIRSQKSEPLQAAFWLKLAFCPLTSDVSLLLLSSDSCLLISDF